MDVLLDDGVGSDQADQAHNSKQGGEEGDILVGFDFGGIRLCLLFLWLILGKLKTILMCSLHLILIFRKNAHTKI